MTEQRGVEPADLYRIRAISDPQISPDARRIAFVLRQMDEEKNEYVSNIYVVEDGLVRQFTSGNKDSAPRWSPDGRWLAFLSSRSETAQIHLMDAGGGESVAITTRKRGAGVPLWSPDSTTIAFVGPVSTTPEKDDASDDKVEKKEPTKILDRSSYKLDSAGFIWNLRRHLFCVDVEARTTTQLTDGDFHDDNPAWAPDSRRLAFVSDRQPNWDVSPVSDIYIVDRSTGDVRRVTSGHAFHAPVFSPDGTRIAVVGLLDPDEAFAPDRLFSIDRAGNLHDEQGAWDASLGNSVSSDVVHSENNSLVWHEDGVYFLGTERGQCNVYRAQNGTVEPMTCGPQTVNGFSVAADGTLTYTRADALHPAETYLLRDGQVTQLTHENEDFLRSVRIAQPERFCFTGAREEESEGWLLKPSGDGPFPLIAYIHGGPATAHGEAFFFEYQLLAARGFAVFFPNIHGSSSYGRDYQCSIMHDWGMFDYQDVLAGVDAAVTRPWVDGARLGIAGGSYGGYMTNWVMTHTNRFKAGVTERCLSNMVSFFGTTDHGWLWNRAWGFYPEQEVQHLWDMSPIKYVESVSGALMVMHSERDDRCPIEQGEQMFNALRRLGKETKMVMFPEESHELSRSGTPSRRIERLNHIVDWFKTHL